MQTATRRIKQGSHIIIGVIAGVCLTMALQGYSNNLPTAQQDRTNPNTHSAAFSMPPAHTKPTDKHSQKNKPKQSGQQNHAPKNHKPKQFPLITTQAFYPNQIYTIQATTFIATQIVFSKDEVIESVQTGDLGAWTASVNKYLPYMLFIKPTQYGSNTNLTVVTNKHTYYFHLTSNSKTQADPLHVTYAMRFIYPAQNIANMQRQIQFRLQQHQAEVSAFQSPKNYNWQYSFSGDAQIMPLHVFDDGRFTYMELRRNQPVPAIFAVTGKNSTESVVNFRREGHYIVILRTAPQFTLRLGQSQVASVFNNRLIREIKQQQWQQHPFI